MKFCQPHWTALKEAIESRGMGHLIAANGRDAFARTVAELEGRAEVDDFDPLMAAHNTIVSRATQDFGLVLFCGDYCPVCEYLKNYPAPAPESRWKSNEEYFIDGPAEMVLAEANARGLMP